MDIEQPPNKMTKMQPRRCAKRARVGDGSCSASATESSTMPGHSSWRDWGSLACGPAMLIADRVLSADVADYVRFRAACSAWRRCTADPYDDALDRRFHPRRWTMLEDVLGRGARPRYLYSRFQNVATGEHIRMTIRGLNGRNGRTFLATTSQGLLVLVNKKTDDVRVANPITGAHVDLPPVTTLLSDYPRDLVYARWSDEVHLCAELTDDSAVVINFGGHRLLGVVRPGDERWSKVECKHRMTSLFSSAGRVYCVTSRTRTVVMVLETSPDHPPRLAEADGANNP